MNTHRRILDQLAGEALAAPDSPIRDTAMGGCLAAVRAARTGLASQPHGHTPEPVPAMPRDLPDTVHGLARLLPRPGSPTMASLALAGANALLPPPHGLDDVKGQDLILEKGRGRRVVVVGHFPFVERLADEFAAFNVLELRPRPGDLPAAAAEEVLPRADVAALTASSLVNGTLGGLLDLLAPEAFVVLLGPSAPFARCLFDFGVDVVAGAEVTDPQAVVDGVAQGLAFRQLKGVRSLAWFGNGA